MWTGGIDALAGDFTRLFEQRLTKGGCDLSDKIDVVIEGEWSPSGTAHEETIYYLAGYVLRAVNKKGRGNKDASPHVFQLLESNALITRDAAVLAGLPTGRVERAEIESLCYASRSFYEVICTVESVYDQLLSEASVYLFGVFLVNDISHYLSKCDVGLEELLPDSSREEVQLVMSYLTSIYGNVRGKDFARKYNLRHGVGQTETTRATLGTIDYLNRIKKEARMKLEQKPPSDVGSLTAEQIGKMKCDELRKALKERGLRVTGNKAELKNRLLNPAEKDRTTRRQQQKSTEAEPELDVDLPEHMMYEDNLLEVNLTCYFISFVFLF